MSISRDDWLAAPRVRVEKVPVPEVGQDAYVRSMSADERDEWEIGQYLVNGKDVSTNRRQLRARLVVRCVCDEHGARTFSNEDLPLVGGMDSKIVDRLYEAAVKVNRLSDADVDDLEKNSVAGPAGNSS